MGRSLEVPSRRGQKHFRFCTKNPQRLSEKTLVNMLVPVRLSVARSLPPAAGGAVERDHPLAAQADARVCGRRVGGTELGRLGCKVGDGSGSPPSLQSAKSPSAT
jgi:hypothetical protein